MKSAWKFVLWLYQNIVLLLCVSISVYDKKVTVIITYLHIIFHKKVSTKNYCQKDRAVKGEKINKKDCSFWLLWHLVGNAINKNYYYSDINNVFWEHNEMVSVLSFHAHEFGWNGYHEFIKYREMNIVWCIVKFDGTLENLLTNLQTKNSLIRYLECFLFYYCLTIRIDILGQNALYFIKNTIIWS